MSQLAQTTPRSQAGQHEMDEMLAQRDKLKRHQQILDANTAAWGMKASANVEIKDIDLDETTSGPWPGRPKPNAAGAPK